MATKKQQKRRYQRAKEHARREGVEGDVPKQSKSAKAGGGGVVTSSGRTVQPASLQRSARRSIVFAALFFALISLVPLGGKRPSPAEALFQSAMIFLWAVLITHVVDNYMYKRAVKRGQSG